MRNVILLIRQVTQAHFEMCAVGYFVQQGVRSYVCLGVAMLHVLSFIGHLHVQVLAVTVGW